jgi:hypothetical protein
VFLEFQNVESVLHILNVPSARSVLSILAFFL